MKLPFLPIHITTTKQFKAEKAARQIDNLVMTKLLNDNAILAKANKVYAEKIRRKKILG